MLGFRGIIVFEELFAKIAHHVAWLLAEHIYIVLLTNVGYYVKKFMTDGVDGAGGLAAADGKNTPSLG